MDTQSYLFYKKKNKIKKTRATFLERFERLIEEYNFGSLSIERAYEELIEQTEKLSEEEQRAAKHGMSETQLELFDLLKKEKLSKKEVKLAAKQLLAVLFDAKNIIEFSATV